MIPLAEIDAAHRRIRPHLLATPVTRDPELGLWLKWENRQVTGSFKPRGALNKVLGLGDGECAAGLVACSAGNHGMGVALAARARGARVTVYASAHASPLKVGKMRELGAEVVLVEGDYGAAEATAIRAASGSGRTFVSPYNDPWVMAGAGTIALEILEEMDELRPSAVLVPAGGGGLLAGVGSALKQAAPGIRVVAVQSEASPYLHEAFHGRDMAAAGERPSLADGLAGPVEPGSATVPIMREVAGDFLLVTEEEIARAVAHAFRVHGEVIEGAAAVGLAAVLAGRFAPGDATVALVTGGNIDPDRHRAIVQAGGGAGAGAAGARPQASASSRSQAIRASPSSSQRKRQPQLPSRWPGRFMRASLPRPSTSCIGTIAIPATDW